MVSSGDLTPDEARNLMMQPAQRSIVDPSLNGPGVDVHAVPYPDISGVPLPEAGGTLGTPGADESSFDAFVRGARGGYAGVLDPSPNAAYAGSLVNDAAQSFKRFGYQMIGAQSADEARAAWNNGDYGLAAAKELQAFGEAGLTLMGVGSAAHAVAGPVMRAVNVAGEYAGSFSANLGAKYGMGLRLSVVEGDPAYTGASDSGVSNNSITGVTYEGPLYRAVPAGGDPLDISYSVRANGRYTAPGQGGLYFASNAGTVEAEFVNNGSSLAGRELNVFHNSSINNLLDLTDPAVRGDLGVSLEDLTRTGGTPAWRYEVTQPLGKFAESQGYNGILAPSAQADGGVNLILFGSKGVR